MVYCAAMKATAAQYEVFRQGSQTYFNSSRFFPRKFRDEVAILYAFVRTADDFVDAVPQDPEGFEAFAEGYSRARDGIASEDHIIQSFVELERERRFDPEWTQAFLHSMRLDLHKQVYETLEETLEYVFGSAEVIGLYMARMMGLPRDADHPAAMLGRSMQFINFIRDIDEDNSLGRTYLPIGETGMNDLRAPSAEASPAEFTSFIRHQVERYQFWQREAEQGYAYLPRRFRIAIKTASDMYNWTGEQIAKNPFLVFTRKVKPKKGRIVLRALGNAVTA